MLAAAKRYRAMARACASAGYDGKLMYSPVELNEVIANVLDKLAEGMA